MTCVEALGLIGTFASIIGLASFWSTRHTNKVLDKMDTHIAEARLATEQARAATTTILERMDQRAGQIPHSYS